MAEKVYDLSQFHLERILSNNSRSKSICVLGTFPSANRNDDDGAVDQKCVDQAIIVLEKTAFTAADVTTDDDTAHRKYFSLNTHLKQEFINDIYGNFQCLPLPEINSNFHIIAK